MKNKGFTMVELLVVIVIVGLISFLGFPVLIRTLTTNSKKEFEVYGDSMIAGAKLYMQKEGYDINESIHYGTNGSTILNQLQNGTFFISLDTLISQNYISPFSSSKKGHVCYTSPHTVNGVSVTSGVYVTLVNPDTNTYSYKYSLVCNNGKEDLVLPE